MNYSCPRNMSLSLLKAFFSVVNVFLSLHLAIFQIPKEETGIIPCFFALEELIAACYFSELCLEVIFTYNLLSLVES